MTTLNLAKQMYDSYCEAVGGKAHNGEPLPKSEEFFVDETKKVQADGWLAAAKKAEYSLRPIKCGPGTRLFGGKTKTKRRW